MLSWETVLGGGAAATFTAIGGWIMGRRKSNAEAGLIETNARHVHWDEAMELIGKLTEEVARIALRLEKAEAQLADCKVAPAA